MFFVWRCLCSPYITSHLNLFFSLPLSQVAAQLRRWLRSRPLSSAKRPRSTRVFASTSLAAAPSTKQQRTSRVYETATYSSSPPQPPRPLAAPFATISASLSVAVLSLSFSLPPFRSRAFCVSLLLRFLSISSPGGLPCNGILLG